MKFRKRPVIIEVEQWFPGWVVPGVCTRADASGIASEHVHTIHNGQAVQLEPGDWIVPEPDGKHYYPIKPEILLRSYDPLDECDCCVGQDGWHRPSCPRVRISGGPTK